MSFKTVIAAVAVMVSGLAFADGAKQMALMSVGYTGSETLTDFQALVKLPDGVAGFSYADYAAQDGSDIWFTDADGNLIPHEIDTWDPSGESLVWVKIPQLESSTSYVVMHWGEARSGEGAAGSAWDGFIGVWHMGSASGSANEPDATGHGLDAVPTPGVISGKKGDISQMTVTDGVVGKARFNQTNKSNHNGLKVPDYSTLMTDASKFSVSGWWRLIGAADVYPRFIAQRPGTSSGAGAGWEIECNVSSTTKISGLRAGNNMNTKLGEFTVADFSQNWMFLTAVYDGTQATLYVNGAKIGSGTLPINTASTEGCMIGNLGVRACGWYGRYDEIRIYDGVMSADRAKADFDTMSDPTAFLMSVDLSAIVVASWIGEAGDGSVANAANWKCYNGYGDWVKDALPTASTVVTVSGEVDMQVPAGTPFAYRSIIFSDCTLTDDCDWRGLADPLFNGRINLDGHTLTVSSLEGTGSIASPGSVPEVVLTGARFWLDASEPGTFGYNPDGTIFSWISKSSRYITLPLATADNGPTLGQMENGRPTVDFGAAGSGKDMRYSRFNDIRTVFMVVKIANTSDAFLLGDYNNGNGLYQFHRGPNGQYGNPSHAKFQSVWNGEDPVEWESDYIPDDSFQIISVVTTQACSSDSLTRDRNITGRTGGRQLSEIILFDTVLSDEERLAVTRYLRKKWFDAETAEVPAGELHIDVPDAETVVTNRSVSIVGNVKVVKEGAGIFFAAKAGQGYYGGNDVEAGTFRTDGNCSYYGVFNTVTIKPDAVFDLDGTENHNGPLFELAGGKLWSGSDARGAAGSAIKNIRLTADSVMGGSKQCAMAGLVGTPVSLDLGGYTLTVDTFADATTRFSKMTATGGGKIIARSGGTLQFGISGRTDPIAATSTVLEVQGSAMNTFAAVDIGDYIPAYEGDADTMTGTTPIRVHGTFVPAGKWHESVLQNGATLDLTGQTGVWTNFCTFAEGTVTRRVTFADDATVTVNVTGRKLQTWEQLVAWDEPPANLATLTFLLDVETGRDLALVVRDDGLYVSGGTLILVR